MLQAVQSVTMEITLEKKRTKKSEKGETRNNSD